MYLLRTIYLDKTGFSTVKQTVKSDLGLSVHICKAEFNSKFSNQKNHPVVWKYTSNTATCFLIWWWCRLMGDFYLYVISFFVCFLLHWNLKYHWIDNTAEFHIYPIQTRDAGSAESGDSWSTTSVKGEWVTGKCFQISLFICLNLNLLPLNPPKADVWFAQYHLLLLGWLNWSFIEFHSRIDRFFFTVLGPWK